jgi:hypothetical protein
MAELDRGAYAPPTDGSLAFDPREHRRRRPLPITLILSVAILLVLITALVFLYRAGTGGDAGGPAREVGEPVGAVREAPPAEAQPVDPATGLEVYTDEGERGRAPSSPRRPKRRSPGRVPPPRRSGAHDAHGDHRPGRRPAAGPGRHTGPAARRSAGPPVQQPPAARPGDARSGATGSEPDARTGASCAARRSLGGSRDPPRRRRPVPARSAREHGWSFTSRSAPSPNRAQAQAALAKPPPRAAPASIEAVQSRAARFKNRAIATRLPHRADAEGYCASGCIIR